MYKSSLNPLRRILKKKLSLEQGTHNWWPMYATYKEDAKLHEKKWDFYFDRRSRERIVMYDTAGVTCAKAGVSNQLCGWIREMPLKTVRITDSQMIKDLEVLVEQRKFSEADTSSDKSLTNVFDKGF